MSRLDWGPNKIIKIENAFNPPFPSQAVHRFKQFTVFKQFRLRKSWDWERRRISFELRIGPKNNLKLWEYGESTCSSPGFRTLFVSLLHPEKWMRNTWHIMIGHSICVITYFSLKFLGSRAQRHGRCVEHCARVAPNAGGPGRVAGGFSRRFSC